jgi:hypothetical protein
MYSMKNVSIESVIRGLRWQVVLGMLLAASCQRIELPPPVLNDEKTFEIQGDINGKPVKFATDRYRMLTDLAVDSLGVRIFKTSFVAIDSSQEELSILIRDNRIYEGTDDTAAVLLPGVYPILGNKAHSGKTFYLKNTLHDQDMSGLVWKYNNNQQQGPYLNIENINPNQSYKICVQNTGDLNNTFLHYCKTFTPAHLKDHFDISVQSFEVNNNVIKPIVDPRTCCNLVYRWNSTSVNTSGELVVVDGGNYSLRIEGKNDHVTDADLSLRFVNERLQVPVFTGFSSELEELAGNPNFSTATIVYKDETGKVYTSDLLQDPANLRVRILGSEHMSERDDLGRSIQKVILQFQSALLSENGDTLQLANFSGQVGFAKE